MFLLILTTAVSFLGAFIPILIKPVSTKIIRCNHTVANKLELELEHKLG